MADLSLQADSAHTNPAPFDHAVQRYMFAVRRIESTADQSDQTREFLVDALVGAESAIMRQPAADLAELRVKADILWTDVDSLPPPRHVLAFFADFVRLTGGGASRVFDPHVWLAQFERSGGGWSVQDDRITLLWPDADCMGGHLEALMNELEMRGGKSAVLALIKFRHDAKEA